mmetsp:Transcript_26803/g.58859  ORF Transcript_26803/g.58859 Transcript_26803/m.58859 type:complete len:167 (-) Transcript_26803:427-927(-)
MAAAFLPADFDPILIMAQIFAMQTMWYMTFGVWLLILNALAGGPIPNIGISLIFSHESISLLVTGGWIVIASYILNALAGACSLCFVVQRARKCLDFTTTAHLIHLWLTYCYDGLPDTWEWWALNALSLALMALLGEFLCMRREMQDIPLFRGGNSADTLLGLHRK